MSTETTIEKTQQSTDQHFSDRALDLSIFYFALLRTAKANGGALLGKFVQQKVQALKGCFTKQKNLKDNYSALNPSLHDGIVVEVVSILAILFAVFTLLSVV